MLEHIVASYGDKARVLRVCSIQSLERHASVEALPDFKYCSSVKYANVLILEIVTGDSIFFKNNLLAY